MAGTYRDKMKELAEKWGWPTEIDKLDAAQYRKLAIAARPLQRRVVDGARALSSRITTSMNLRVVPQEIADANFAVCTGRGASGDAPAIERCGHYAESRDGKPVCDLCNCSSADLMSKIRDGRQRCPAGKWDNRKVPRAVVTEKVVNIPVDLSVHGKGKGTPEAHRR